MNRSRVILTSIAVSFFLTAYILEVSSYGRDWNDLWKNFAFERFFLILLVNLAIGVLLAIFLFRKRSYKQRLSMTVPIAFILFSLANLYQTVTFEYGLHDEHNYFAAQRDIKSGKVQILSTGLPVESFTEEYLRAEEALEKQFGYKSVWLGCTWTPGIDKYNSAVEDYLEKRNGTGWRRSLLQRLDSLRNSMVQK